MLINLKFVGANTGKHYDMDVVEAYIESAKGVFPDNVFLLKIVRFSNKDNFITQDIMLNETYVAHDIFADDVPFTPIASNGEGLN
jgi:hypothetical protein